MKFFLCSVSILILWTAAVVHASDCQQIAGEMELPEELETDGELKIARWQKVDQILNALSEHTQGSECSFRFDEVFDISDPEEAHFPITNTVLRVVPEEALAGLTVFRKDAEAIGIFDSRVLYERSGGLYAQTSYTLYYFQFKDGQGKFHSSGNRLLLDEYLVRWSDIKGRPALDRDAMESSSDSLFR